MSPTSVGAAIGQAAENLLTALPADQQAALQFAFDDPERLDWHYVPGRRRGVSLAEMGRQPARLVHQLLATVVSRATHTRVTAITGLEDVLDESEGGRRGRHAGDYRTAIFGDPGSPRWGWRFEGHHVSINVTVSDGATSATPFFLGANPATVTDERGSTVSRPLAPEADVGLALLTSLDDDQRKRAAGLPATALRPNQVALLRSLAALYVNRVSSNLAEPVLAEVDRDLPAFCFVWAEPATPSPGQPRYYRLEGPRFLAEFDSRQHGANHVHSLWREPGGDFGARLLPEGIRGLS